MRPYRVADTHRMPYLYRSFSAKESYNHWLCCETWPATLGILWVFATLWSPMKFGCQLALNKHTTKLISRHTVEEAHSPKPLWILRVKRSTCPCGFLDCITLQCTSTHCDALQCTAWSQRSTCPRGFLDCSTLQCTAMHYNALQCTATHCNTLQCTAWSPKVNMSIWILGLYHTAMHCNTLRCTATHCKVLQCTAMHCNALQHTAMHCLESKGQHVHVDSSSQKVNILDI